MTGFRDIIGHEDVVQHLQNAIAAGKISHSYILAGDPGVGKKLIANTFAAALLCEKGGIEPCLQCSSCKKAEARNHPDIIHVTHEKPNLISIDEIRTQVVQSVSIRPYYGSYKIYLIPDAELMNIAAQNALLKTIEEPPSYAVIILITSNADALLPTILSRCVRLEVKVVEDSLIKKYLMEKLQVPDYEADVEVSMAHGSVGRAKEAATSREFMDFTEKALHLLKNADTMDTVGLNEAVREVTEDKQRIEEYLDIFQFWFRDVLMFKATREMDHLVFKQQFNDIREQAGKRSYENLEKILEAIEMTRARLRANVNMELAVELLFMTVREK